MAAAAPPPPPPRSSAAAAARGPRRPRQPKPPGATATSSLSTPPRRPRPLSPKAPKSRKGLLGGVFRSPGRAEKRKVVPPLLPDPLSISLSPPPSSIFSLGPRCLLLFFPHPPETRKHAREQAPAVSLALAATATQLRLGREQRVEPRSAAPPVPVEAGSSSGLKRIHKAAAPREERWGSVPPPSQPPMAEKLMWPPPKDASEKSACGNSPWPWILRLSPRPLRSEDKCFLTMEILQL